MQRRQLSQAKFGCSNGGRGGTAGRAQPGDVGQPHSLPPHPSPWPNLPGAEGSRFLGERYRNVNAFSIVTERCRVRSKASNPSNKAVVKTNANIFSNPPHHEGTSPAPSSHLDPLLPPLRGDALKIGHPTAVHPMAAVQTIRDGPWRTWVPRDALPCCPCEFAACHSLSKVIFSPQTSLWTRGVQKGMAA